MQREKQITAIRLAAFASALVLVACVGCTDGAGSGGSIGPPEVDNRRERYLTLMSALEALGNLRRLVSDADESVEALNGFLTNPEGLNDLFELYQGVDRAWNAVLTHLEAFTPEQKEEVPSLGPAIERMASAAAAWQSWGAAFWDFFRTSFRQDAVDPSEGRRVDRSGRFAQAEESRAMNLVDKSQDEATIAISDLPDSDT